jgi:hypothetical protein
MSRITRKNLSWAFVVVFVLAAVLVPAAGAARTVSVGSNGIQPTSPWYAYDAALRKAQHQRQAQSLRSIQPTSPWYAYDAALRKAQHQRQEQSASSRQRTHRAADRSITSTFITDTLGGNGKTETLGGTGGAKATND